MNLSFLWWRRESTKTAETRRSCVSRGAGGGAGRGHGDDRGRGFLSNCRECGFFA
jgi:hypothetical protein